MPHSLLSVPRGKQIAAFKRIMQTARRLGFRGFSGECGAAAVAINQVLLDGQADIHGCFNETFHRRGWPIGHIAVCASLDGYSSVYLDADGQPKDANDVESWAMLDIDDPDLRTAAAKLGFRWTQRAADAVDHVVFDSADEVLATMPSDSTAALTATLQAATDWFFARHHLRSPTSRHPRSTLLPTQ